MFGFTPEGYVLAYNWLKEHNYLDLIDKEQSIDGFTVVALANSLKERDESNN